MLSRLVLAAVIGGLIAAPAAAQAPGVMKKALSDLVNAQKGFAGHVDLTEAPGGVLMRVEVQGLSPGWHGMHLHEKADCSAADFTSAGGHINHATAKKAHGLLNPQGPDFGDLPNLYVDADGRGKAEAYTTLVKFSELTDADGSASSSTPMRTTIWPSPSAAPALASPAASSADRASSEEVQPKVVPRALKLD